MNDRTISLKQPGDNARVPMMRGRTPAQWCPPPDGYDTVQVLTVVLVGAERGHLKEEVGSADKTCLCFQKKSASGLTLVFSGPGRAKT